MRIPLSLAAVAVSASVLLAVPAATQPAPMPAGTPEQRAAIARLDSLDGEWIGTAWMRNRDGSEVTTRHTERVGSLLGGSIKVVEGRSYDARGETVFNAFAIVSWDPATKVYSFSTFAMGGRNVYPLTTDGKGFVWEMPAGPNAKIRYTAEVADGVWREIGEYMPTGGAPAKFIELTLKRTGPSAWPSAGAVEPGSAG